ncbi:hypothetical protein [Saccharibacillus sacchari]|uniref:Uncharacterized protein n=1 Tax=Saccharibacillus sacchari TaxID=456493 RepID=A0ACC6PID1_9BACL
MSPRQRVRRANVEVDDNTLIPEMIQRLRGLVENEVHIGMEGGGELALIAAVHEFGSAKMNIPARSYIGTAKKKAQAAISKAVRAGVTEIALGTRDPTSLLQQLGEIGLDKTLKNFDRIKQPPLSPIYASRKRGRKLLVSDRDLRGSIVFKVVAKS